MSTTVKFLILYLIPILTVSGTLGTFLLAYGKRSNGFIKFVFKVVILGLIAACYITVVLLFQFLTDDIVYSGVLFSILGCFFEFLAFAYYIVMFKDELRSFR